MFFRGLTLSAHVFEKECKPLSNGIKAIVAKVMKFNVSFIQFVFKGLDCLFDSSCNILSTIYSET